MGTASPTLTDEPTVNKNNNRDLSQEDEQEEEENNRDLQTVDLDTGVIVQKIFFTYNQRRRIRQHLHGNIVAAVPYTYHDNTKTDNNNNRNEQLHYIILRKRTNETKKSYHFNSCIYITHFMGRFTHYNIITSNIYIYIYTYKKLNKTILLLLSYSHSEK